MEYFKKVWAKLIGLFKRGLTPNQLALSISLTAPVFFFSMHINLKVIQLKTTPKGTTLIYNYEN